MAHRRQRPIHHHWLRRIYARHDPGIWWFRHCCSNERYFRCSTTRCIHRPKEVLRRPLRTTSPTVQPRRRSRKQSACPSILRSQQNYSAIRWSRLPPCQQSRTPHPRLASTSSLYTRRQRTWFSPRSMATSQHRSHANAKPSHSKYSRQKHQCLGMVPRLQVRLFRSPHRSDRLPCITAPPVTRIRR